MRRGSIVCAAIALVAAFALFWWPAVAQRTPQQAGAPPPAPAAITIEARPIPAFDHRDPERKRFGMLEYRGGLVLTSSFPNFGGISALSVAADGANLLAATDRGWWLRGRITYDGIRPAGIAAAEMAPLLGPDGRTLAARRWYDSEALARDGDTVYVGIERVHRIVRFNYGKDGLTARGHPISAPAGFHAMPANGGIEGLVFLPHGGPLGGTLLAISERGHDRAGNHLAFLIGGPRPGTFTLRRKDNFDVSDAALLPPGELLVLERKFGWTTGLFIRIRRIAIAGIRPGALLDGSTVFEADLGQQIDNMEGISIHRSGTDTVLTLISDDNFSPIQRTLLLQFTLVRP
jgi:hypothetical protein